MLVLRRMALLAAIFSICVLPSLAVAESSYVYCDNGLRCVMAPCPSNSALDLATGKIIKGVSIDIDELPRGGQGARSLGQTLRRQGRGFRLDREPDPDPQRQAIHSAMAGRDRYRTRLQGQRTRPLFVAFTFISSTAKQCLDPRSDAQETVVVAVARHQHQPGRARHSRHRQRDRAEVELVCDLRVAQQKAFRTFT